MRQGRVTSVLLFLVFGALLLSAGCRAQGEAAEASQAPPTLTSGATLTPATTPLPSLVPTAVPSPTPSPTPTPSPRDLLTSADWLFHIGDYAAAVDEYLAALSQPLDAEQIAHARLRLGQALIAEGRYSEVGDVLRSVADSGETVTDTRVATFLLGQAQEGAGDPTAAARAYQDTIRAGTVVTGYLSERIGDALAAAGEVTGALAAYDQAVASAPNAPFRVGVREKSAQTHVLAGDPGAALAEYEAILAEARIPAYRARILYQAAETAALGGDLEEARARYLSLVEAYPEEQYAYLALVALVEAGWPVDDYLRGKVDYHGGAYEPAIAALERFLAEGDQERAPEATIYLGRSYLAAGDANSALSTFDAAVRAYPDSDVAADAWFGKANAYVALDEIQTAVATYQRFAEVVPNSSRAPEAMWKAAHLLEEQGELLAAAEAYVDCQVAFPDASRGQECLFHGGLLYLRAGDLAQAGAIWDAFLATYPSSSIRPAVHLWMGKLRTLQGDLESGRENLSLAAQQAADDWYGLRAADLLTGRLDPFESTASGYSGYRPTASDRQEAGRWLSDWLGLESATGIGALDDTLLADPRMARGMELWRLGLLAEARSEFEALRIATFDDALAQYRLASYFSEIGLYRSSILCAVRVIGLSPAEGPLQAPRYLSALAYPTYYEDLAVDVAEDYRLDVRLVFALIRQESLFESLAYSPASAHGLMQVIPATGAEIADQLGWPATYQTSDLYRPHVSLRFGTFYLAQQRDRFGRLDAALAGYNGGPFNAAIWLEEAGGDPDAFFEVISLAETRLYLERIKEHYAVYRTLYNSSGGGER